MYYKDLLAAAEKDISSRNFCTLVDAAVKLYEEEEERKKSEIKEEEEEKKKKSEINEEEEEEKKEEKEIDFLELVPKKRRSVTNFVTTRRRDPSQFHENINGASTSSSSLLDLQKSYSSTSSVDYSTKEKSEMKIPQNPNSQSSLCVTEEKGRTGLAMQETKPSDKFKKAKVGSLSWKGRETPERLIQLMKDMGGYNLKLIFEKTLTETDCNRGQGRLSMPVLSPIHSDFLTLEEITILEKDIQSKNKSGIDVILFDQRGVRWDLKLKRWEAIAKRSFDYALVCGWKDVVEANGFRGGLNISVWAFRCGQGRLCFALFPLPTTE